MHLTHPSVKRLQELYRPIKTLEEISAILDWDMNVNLPEAAGETRGNQSAFITEIITSNWNQSEIKQLFDELSNTQLDGANQAFVRTLSHASQYYLKVPSEVVAERARASSEAFMAWQQAKRANDFKSFEPYLTKNVELAKIVAGNLGFDLHPYDALLNLYDQGLTTATCTNIFEALQPQLTKLIQQIQKSPSYCPDSPLLEESMLYPESAQRQLSQFILKKMGYDFASGRIDLAMHPFSTGLGQGDTRITTRFLPHDFRSALAASMHEGGHALYTQGIAQEFSDVSLESELSFAIHESQSRFWENQIGRSPEFLAFATPLLQAFFPEQLAETGTESLIHVFNLVKPSLIRIEADEVTYCLHIMVRFELERDLINGQIKVKDLPEAWRAKMKDYLGIEPQTDSEGVLQDVHWSNGYFGYFPSYALGNLYAAQFSQKLKSELDFSSLVSRGEFGPILSWLRTNIHQYGSYYTAKELVNQITGEDLNPQYFLEYLSTKFGALYY